MKYGIEAYGTIFIYKNDEIVIDDSTVSFINKCFDRGDYIELVIYDRLVDKDTAWNAILKSQVRYNEIVFKSDNNSTVEMGNLTVNPFDYITIKSNAGKYDKLMNLEDKAVYMYYLDGTPLQFMGKAKDIIIVVSGSIYAKLDNRIISFEQDKPVTFYADMSMELHSDRRCSKFLLVREEKDG